MILNELKSYNLIQSWGTLILKNWKSRVTRVLHTLHYGVIDPQLFTPFYWDNLARFCSFQKVGLNLEFHFKITNAKKTSPNWTIFMVVWFWSSNPKWDIFVPFFIRDSSTCVQQHSHVCFFWYLEDIIFRPVWTFFFDSPIIRGLVKLSTNDMNIEIMVQGGKRFSENHQGFWSSKSRKKCQKMHLNLCCGQKK